MSIANAVKVGIAVVAGYKLATASYKICKSTTAARKKFEFLAEKGVPLEDTLFATDAQLDALVKEYA